MTQESVKWLRPIRPRLALRYNASSLLLSAGIAGWDEEADFDLTFSFSSFTLKCAYGIITAHKVKVQ